MRGKAWKGAERRGKAWTCLERVCDAQQLAGQNAWARNAGASLEGRTLLRLTEPRSASYGAARRGVPAPKFT